jgi:V-type H+-transporting ATPase subunit H
MASLPPTGIKAEFKTYTLSGIHSTYLHDTAKLIRSRQIQWEAYFKANMMTEEELSAMNAFMKSVTGNARAGLPETGAEGFEAMHEPVYAEMNAYCSMIQKEGDAYVKLVVELLQKIVRVDTVQYLLVLVDDAVELMAFFPAVLTRLLSDNNKTILTKFYAVMLRCLDKEDEFTQLKAAKIITELLCQSRYITETQLIDFLSFLLTHINPGLKPSVAAIDVGLQCLMTLLRETTYRKIVWNYRPANQLISQAVNSLESKRNASLSLSAKDMDFVRCWVELVCRGKQQSPQQQQQLITATPQVQYQVLTCLWLESFVPEIASQLHSIPGMFEMIVEILKTSIKEKVVRVVLALLKNMILLARTQTLTTMIGYKIPQAIDALTQRKWSDEDVKDDLKWLKSELALMVQQLSTWDEYYSEVRSGKLEWSPPHVNETFWKRHAQKLGEHQGELMKLLNEILSTSHDPVSLGIACHDISQLIRYEPQLAKKWLSETGAKIRIMELMTHENSEVRYYALVATQAYMSNMWQ